MPIRRSEPWLQWITCVSTNTPHLTKPQATVLALWSFGIACTRSCGRRTVATFLALLPGQKVANLAQRCTHGVWLRPTKPDANADVTTGFVPLLG